MRLLNWIGHGIANLNGTFLVLGLNRMSDSHIVGIVLVRPALRLLNGTDIYRTFTDLQLHIM